MFFPVVTIGFNNKGVAVEGEVARVCAVVKGPSVPCPAAFSFDLLLTTSNADEDSASKVYE